MKLKMTKTVESHHAISQEHLDELGNAWSRLIDCISHDIASPLASLRATGKILEEVFPALVTTYQVATNNKLEIPEISARKLEASGRLICNIESEINRLTDFLNLLRPYDKKLISDSQDIKSLSIKSCVDNLLNKFPFSNDKERKLVHTDCKHDFQFRCAAIFIENLLNNFLENALHAIQKANKGEITIWTSEDADYNILHFKDTSLGMDEDAINEVFKRFFKKIDNVIVPGLGFCRLAMLQMDGNVICKSVKNEYTEFLIKFPK